MRKWHCIQVICLLLTGLCGKTQVLNKDSLLTQISAAPEDSNKVKLYYALADQYLRTDLSTAATYYAKGGELSRKIHFVTGVLRYYAGYSNVLNGKGHFNEKLRTDLAAYDYAQKNAGPEDIAITLLNTGGGYLQLKDYENAVSYIEQAKALFHKAGLYQYDGKMYNFLQFLYYSMHQYRKGVHAGFGSVQAGERSNDTDLLMLAYNNLGLNYIQLHLYDSAKHFLNKASALANDLGDMTVQITTALNFALISLKQQQLDSIRLYCQKALTLAQKYEAHEYEGLAQYGLAYHYLLKQQYPVAQRYADSAMALANTYNMRDLKQKSYAVSAALHYAMQDGKKGYHYFDQYELLTDSMLNESITNNTIRIEKKFETEKKEAQITLQRSQLHQQNILNCVLAGSIVALLIISLLSYRNYKTRQTLQQAKIDELETEKHLTATEAVLKGEEQERTRLAKDLHDGLGGMLSGIKHSLRNMKGNLIMTPDNALAFERSIDMLDSSIQEMRRVAHNMMPEVLIKYGLNVALKEFCDEMNRSGAIHVSYQFVGAGDKAIEQITAVTIYRIVQELANNAIKHGQASNLLVQLHQSSQERLLNITVEDDGKGFDQSILGRSKGIGWSNIQNRVEFLKGKIDVRSEPGKGTSVFIELNV